MADQLEKNTSDRGRPDLPGLNLLDLLKPEKLAAAKPADEIPKTVSADNPNQPSTLTLENAKTIVANAKNWDQSDLDNFVEKMNKVDQHIASKIFADPDELTEQSFDKMRQSSTQIVDMQEWFGKNPELSQKFNLSPAVLEHYFGARPLQEYKNFVGLMDRIGDRSLPHNAQQQVNVREVFAVAQSPLSKLPDAVISDLLKLRLVSRHSLTYLSEADTKRLPSAIKAWALTPTLPLKVAEKVGSLTAADQMAVAIAFNTSGEELEAVRKSSTADSFWKDVIDPLKKNSAVLLKNFGELAVQTPEEMLRNARFEVLVNEMMPDQSSEVQKAFAKELSKNLRWGDKTNPNPVELIKQTNIKIFAKELLERPESPADALKLSLLFQNTERLDLFRQQHSKSDSAEILKAVKLGGAKDLKDLGEWLTKGGPKQLSVDAKAVVVATWPCLTEKQRQMGQAELFDYTIDMLERMGTDVEFLDQTSIENLKTVFHLDERFSGLSSNELKLLSRVASRQPNLMENLKAEQLSDALKGWAIEADFSPEVAAKVGANKHVWEQVAAKVAWKALSKDAPANEDISKKTERFPGAFEAVKAKGKFNVLLEHGDPFLAAKSMFPTIDSDYLLTLATVVSQESTRDGENPVRKLSGLQAGAFRDALDTLRKENVGLDYHVVQMVANQWQPQAAFGLASTFGKEWPKWLELTSKRGIDTHDATHWLPQRTPASNEGLKDFLFKNVALGRDMTELELVAKRWPQLTPEQQKLPYKELVTLVQSVKYLNSKNEGFAKESAKWSVNEKFYNHRENRFLASRDTPSPFPVGKTWESGNLTGFFLPRNDPRGLYMGQHTGCCQHPDGVGFSSAWHGQESPDGGFFVIVDKSKPGEILAGSWAWVSDDGGMCFDSIEAINVKGREKPISEIYKKAATDLSTKFHTVTTSKASKFSGLGNHMADCPAAGADAQSLPSNYKAYTDVTKTNQVILAKNEQTPKRTDAAKQFWVRGIADGRDQVKIQELSKEIYPKGWRAVPAGDLEMVLETREHGPVGYAVLDVAKKAVHDLAVLPDHKNKSALLLRSVLKQIGDVGGEWTCSARESTSYAVLKLAEKRGLIKINDTKVDGEMNGEKMYSVKFEVIPQKPSTVVTAPAAEKSGIQPQERQVVTRPNTTTGPKLSEKAVYELNKQLTSAIELVNPPTGDDGKPPQLKDLTPEVFKDVLDTALTKMKNNPDVSSDELVLIDELQKSLDSKTPAATTRLTALQAELAALSSSEPKAAPNPSVIASGGTTQVKPNTPAKPNELLLPKLTIVAEAADKAAASDKKDGKLVVVEEEKGRDTKPGDLASKKPGMKAGTKYAAGGIGGLVGLLTVAEGGLQLYEWLNKDKEKDKKKADK